MTTISGVLLRHLDRLPAVGDEVVVEGIRLQGLAVEGHRISRLRAMPVTEKTYELATDADGAQVENEGEGERSGPEDNK